MKVESESEVTQSCLTLHDPQAPPSVGFSRQEQMLIGDNFSCDHKEGASHLNSLEG